MKTMLKAVGVAAALTVTTIPASVALAHTPNVNDSCSKLSISLTNYEAAPGPALNNRVTVTIDGASHTHDFDGSFSEEHTWPQTESHTWSVVIDANRVNGNATQFDRTFTGTQTACQTTTTSTTTTTTTTTVPDTTTTTTTQPDTTTTTTTQPETTTTVPETTTTTVPETTTTLPDETTTVAPTTSVALTDPPTTTTIPTLPVDPAPATTCLDANGNAIPAGDGSGCALPKTGGESDTAAWAILVLALGGLGVLLGRRPA